MAVAIPALAAIGTVASVATSVMGAAGAFDGKKPAPPPTEGDASAKQSRRDRIVRASSRASYQNSILAGETEDPKVKRSTLLGA